MRCHGLLSPERGSCCESDRVSANSASSCSGRGGLPRDTEESLGYQSLLGTFAGTKMDRHLLFVLAFLASFCNGASVLSPPAGSGTCAPGSPTPIKCWDNFESITSTSRATAKPLVVIEAEAICYTAVFTWCANNAAATYVTHALTIQLSEHRSARRVYPDDIL